MNLFSLFETVFSVSLMGSAVAVFVITAKAVFGRKLPRRWHMLIWLVVFLRFMMPVSFKSNISIFNIPKMVKEAIAEKNSSIEYDINDEYKDNIFINNINNNVDSDSLQSDRNLIQENKNQDYVSENSNTDNDKLFLKGIYISKHIISLIWLIGVLLVLINYLRTYIKFRYYTKRNEQCSNRRVLNIFEKCCIMTGIKKKINLVYCNKINTPCIVGVISPRIYLSSDFIRMFNQKQMRYIFLHELTHYKDKHIIFSWVTVILKAIYWFNPLIWYITKKFREDCEIITDYGVLSYVGETGRKSYGMTVLSLFHSRSKENDVVTLTGMADRKKSLEKRIKKIAEYREKIKIKYILAAVVIFIGIASTGLTNATDSTKQNINIKFNELEKASISIALKQTANYSVPESIVDALEKYTHDDLNIDIQFIMIPAYNNGYLYEDLLLEMLYSGKSFDAFYLEGSRFDTVYNKISNYIMDISYEMLENAPNMYEKYSVPVKNQIWVDQSIYYIPALFDSSGNIYYAVKKELAGKYGLCGINTYAELDEKLSLIKQNKGNVNVTIFPGLDTVDLFAQAGGYIKYPDGYVYKPDNPISTFISWESTLEFQNALNMLQNWNRNGYLRRIINGRTVNMSDYAYSDILLFSAKDAVNTIISYGDKYYVRMLYEDKTACKTGIYETASIGGGLCINKNSLNYKRALMFLDTIHSDINAYNILMHGIDKDGANIVGNTNNYFEQWLLSSGNAFLDSEFILRNKEEHGNMELNVLLANVIEKSSYAPHQYMQYDFNDKENELYRMRQEKVNEIKEFEIEYIENLEHNINNIQQFVIQNTEKSEKLFYQEKSRLSRWSKKQNNFISKILNIFK